MLSFLLLPRLIDEEAEVQSGQSDSRLIYSSVSSLPNIDYVPYFSLQEEMNGWLEAVAASVGEHAEIARWGQTQPTTSSTDEGNPKREAGERRASGRRK